MCHINREGDERKPLLLDMLRVMRDKCIAHPAIHLIPQKPDILNPSRLHRDTQVLDALGIAQTGNHRLDIRLQGREDIIHLQRELKKLPCPCMTREVKDNQLVAFLGVLRNESFRLSKCLLRPCFYDAVGATLELMKVSLHISRQSWILSYSPLLSLTELEEGVLSQITVHDKERDTLLIVEHTAEDLG